MPHPDFPDYPKGVRGAAGIAVVEAVAAHGDFRPVFVVYFRGCSMAFDSAEDALAFAEHVAKGGWDEDWEPHDSLAP